MFWIIVEMSTCYENGRFGGLEISDSMRRPSHIHLSKERAEIELLRLKKKNPLCDFVLFEAIAEAEGIPNYPGVYRVEPL